MIPEATREILKGWQKSGLLFCFDGLMAKTYSIPEQPIPEGMSVEMVKAMWRQGLRLRLEFNCAQLGWMIILDSFDWRFYSKNPKLIERLRIPAQPIPEKLLEEPTSTKGIRFAGGINSIEKNVHMGFPDAPKPPVRVTITRKNSIDGLMEDFDFFGTPEQLIACEEDGWTVKTEPKPTIPHLAERKLWLAQREAGTNEIWRYTPKHRLCCWIDMPVDKEPSWDVECVYEVKPKTVTYYFALMVHSNAKTIASFTFDNRNDLVKFCDRCNYTIIGNIETREVEVLNG